MTDLNFIPLTVDKSHLVTIGERLYVESLDLIRELVNNAYDADATLVELTVTPNEILVKDNGSGIPAENLPHIFKRFYRVGEDRSRKTGGSGLGLTISKIIAEAHKGNIEVESDIGKGSIFKIILPVN